MPTEPKTSLSNPEILRSAQLKEKRRKDAQIIIRNNAMAKKATLQAFFRNYSNQPCDQENGVEVLN